jgi:hypothetical protein
MPWNNFRNVLIRIVIIAAPSLLGCAQSPHIKGWWVGTVVPVVLHDRLGRSFDAAALRIESGPTWGGEPWYGEVSPILGGGKVPLLVWAKTPKSIPNCPLRIDEAPEGRRVRVAGTMYFLGASIPAYLSQTYPGEQFLSRRWAVTPSGKPGNPLVEHVIVLRGKPKLMRD